MNAIISKLLSPELWGVVIWELGVVVPTLIFIIANNPYEVSEGYWVWLSVISAAIALIGIGMAYAMTVLVFEHYGRRPAILLAVLGSVGNFTFAAYHSLVYRTPYPVEGLYGERFLGWAAQGLLVHFLSFLIGLTLAFRYKVVVMALVSIPLAFATTISSSLVVLIFGYGGQ